MRVFFAVGLLLVSFASAQEVQTVRTDTPWFNTHRFSKFKMGGGTGEGNYFWAMDFMTRQDEAAALSFGLQMSYLNYEAAKSQNQRYGSVYTFSSLLMLGYNLQPLTGIPLQLKGGAGYGVLRNVDENEWGMAYTVAAETDIYKGFGLGVSHLWQKNDFEDKEETILYLSFSF